MTAAIIALSVAAMALLAASPAGKKPGYAPLSAEASSEVLVRTLDTESSLGPLSATPQAVTLADLVRFHGHPCDGLIAAAKGIALGLRALFPDGVVDRTDVAAATNASPCYSDVAAYLTGARPIYGTLVIDKGLGDEWFLLRRSTGRAVRVRLKPGIKPAELTSRERDLRQRGCDPALIEYVQRLQLKFIHRLLVSAPESLYQVEALPSFPYPVGGQRPDASMARCPR